MQLKKSTYALRRPAEKRFNLCETPAVIHMFSEE